MRAHLPVLVDKLARLGTDLALTTNAVTLALVADDLAAAGLRRVNVSLDSLRRARVTDLTRRDALDRVLEGIDAALDAGLSPVKLNAVVVRGVNDDEVVDLAAFGRDRGRRTCGTSSSCRSTPTASWKADQVVPAAEIVAAIGAALAPRGGGPGPRAGPALALPRRRRRDRRDPVGHRRLLRSCDRVRLTADGQLRSCLFAADETDLRGPLRAGASDDELAAAHHRPPWRPSGPATASAEVELLPPAPLDVPDRRLSPGCGSGRPGPRVPS